jgi:hypothetical protein
MITLLTAILGKDVIPDNVRKALLVAGVSLLSYRLFKVYKQFHGNKQVAKTVAPMISVEKSVIKAVS